MTYWMEEHRWMDDGKSNGSKLDNAVSIQTMGTQTWSDDNLRFPHVSNISSYSFSANLFGGPSL